MKDILMLVHTMGTLLPSDNDRFTYIAKLLLDRNADVEMVTSDFEHHKKCYRNLDIAKEHPFKITFIHENQYKKNISFGRIWGHISFAFRLKKYLKERKVPDVIYCAIPPTISAYFVAKYAKKKGVKFIVDVQDLWPESFLIPFKNNRLVALLLSPLKLIVNKAYKLADEVIAVSETYVNRVKQVNTKAKRFESVYLGTDGNRVNLILKEFEKKENLEEFKIGYVGNIGKSYDFENLLKALMSIKDKGIENIKLYIIGDGNERNYVEQLSSKYYSNTLITGYLPYEDMIKMLASCDIAVNPIVKGTASSIVNKVGDYAAVGIPVINTQDNEEYRKLLEKYQVGLNTIPEDANDIGKKILELYYAPQRRKEMGENNYRLFTDKFDRVKTYERIIDCII